MRQSYLIGKAFNQYLWASVLTVATTQVANIIDATIVGNLIGPDALAAVNLSKPLLQTLFAISCLYVPAATILTGVAIGKGDTGHGGSLFSFSLLLSLVLGLLCTVGGLVFFGGLSRFLCPSETLYPLAADFMKVTLLSAVPQLIMYTIHQFVTVDGSPRLVTLSVLIGNIFNILLDIVFIKYCGMGIAGAAWATFTMYIVCILTALLHFRKAGTLRLKALALSHPREEARRLELGRLFGIGLPLFFSTVLLSVQYVGNNYVADTYLGDSGLVALAVCMQLFSLSMIILTGTLRTIQPVGSILRGMDDHHGMLLLMRRAYRFLAICLVVYAAFLIFIPGSIAAALGVVPGCEAAGVLKTALPLFSLHIVMQGLLYNMMPIFQFYGRKHLALFLSIAQTLLPMVFFFLLRGHWIGFFLGQLVTALVLVVWIHMLRRRDVSLSPFFLIPLKPASQVFEQTMPTSLQNLDDTILRLNAFLTEAHFHRRTVFHACLCTEEFLKNIVQHGHAHVVDVGATIVDGCLNVTLHDDGRPFNPISFTQSDPDRIGLGLKIAQGVCRHFDYKFLFNQNMLTMQFSSEAECEN